MIKNDATISGTPLNVAKFNSKEQVVRICDSCGVEDHSTVNTILRCRKKHNTNKDYCLKCACKIYNSGELNSAKRPEVRKRISEANLGKTKKFRDGKNLRILDKKLTVNGYSMKWSDTYNRYIQEHRLVYAEKVHKHPDELEEIHHLDGDKKNNSINNLIELTGSEHSSLHSQLENLAFELVKKGIICFSPSMAKYYLHPDIELQKLEISYGFDSIAIKQQKNICKSRLEVDTTSEIIRGIKIKIPLIAANMSTVINSDFYIRLHKLGAFAVLHRAANFDKIVDEIKSVRKECEWVAASLGIEADQFDVAKQLIVEGCNILVIDVAHGYSDTVLQLGTKIKSYAPNVKIVLGNTTNPDLLYASYKFADALKVGIAQGMACETKNTAGCTEKQFSAVLKFKQISKDYGIPIISDGGIREPADFTKAIAAGANSVMAGSIFAACPESAADVEIRDGVSKKIYAGMASRYVQERWKGGLKPGTCPEGGIRYLDIGESAEKLLERYSGALKSGVTYSGANDIESFQKNVKFVKLEK